MVFAEMVTNTIIFLAKLSPERFTKFWTSFDFSWFSGHDTPLFFLFFENLKTFVYIFSKFKNSWNWELWNRHPKANRQNRWRLIRKVRQLLFDCQFRIPKLRTQSAQSVFEKWQSPNSKTKTFWKIESPNAISGIHLGGMAKKIFFLVTKLFCFSR